MTDKSAILEALIRLHQKELASSQELIERLKNSPSFGDAVEKARMLVPRLEKLIQEFTAQKALYSKPSTRIEVGALASVDSTQYGVRQQLIVHDTEISFFDPRDYSLAAVKLSAFEFTKVGEAKSYFTGRPGEEFEVVQTLLRIE